MVSKCTAAHELNPLNTIFLVLNDLIKDKDLIKNETILKDIILLKSQADRCKEILQKLSQNPLKLKDKFLEKVKLTDLIKINFDKFNNNNKKNIKIVENFEGSEPEIIYKDEIMYLENIIQNRYILNKKHYSRINIFKQRVNIKVFDNGTGFKKIL